MAIKGLTKFKQFILNCLDEENTNKTNTRKVKELQPKDGQTNLP